MDVFHTRAGVQPELEMLPSDTFDAPVDSPHTRQSPLGGHHYSVDDRTNVFYTLTDVHK